MTEENGLALASRGMLPLCIHRTMQSTRVFTSGFQPPTKILDFLRVKTKRQRAAVQRRTKLLDFLRVKRRRHCGQPKEDNLLILIQPEAQLQRIIILGEHICMHRAACGLPSASCLLAWERWLGEVRLPSSMVV